jgi:hypothetical protein
VFLAVGAAMRVATIRRRWQLLLEVLRTLYLQEVSLGCPGRDLF